MSHRCPSFACPRGHPTAQSPERHACRGVQTLVHMSLGTDTNTHDGLAAARARGRVGGRKPKLSPQQAALAQQQYDAGDKTVQQIADSYDNARDGRTASRPT